jgi:tRNA nucleotidyltransferase/poly(A) polymerase
LKFLYKNATYEAVESPSTEKKILNAVKNARKYDESKENKLYRVGGVVRDEIFGAKSKDIDYLVTNVAFEDLKKALAAISDKIVSTGVGESMQVIKAVIDGSEEPYDFAIPRTEVYGGSGKHDDVQTFGDPSLPVEADLSRRDLSFNAIAKDVETGEYIDPFGGVEDIKQGRIKAVRDPKERFAEDPLRMLRAIQFANRFGFEIEPETLKAIRENVDLIDNITGERILEEFKKAFTKGKFQSNEKIVDLLTETGLGKHIFGQDFNPVKVPQVKGDKFVVNLILMFLNGGDYTKLKLPTEVSHAIMLARMLKTMDALNVMFKNRHYLQYMQDSAESMNNTEMLKKLESLNGVPLSNKELNISSQWLMDRGYQGRDLGNAQLALIVAIYEKKLKNETVELERYVEALQ